MLANCKYTMLFDTGGNKDIYIKSNGDRVSDNIKDLRHAVTELMASQNDMDKTLIKSLQVTTSTLPYVLSIISRIEGKTALTKTSKSCVHKSR